MNTKNLKNILAMIGYTSTILCVSTTPHMVKWYIGLYVIYLIAVWLGHEDEQK